MYSTKVKRHPTSKEVKKTIGEKTATNNNYTMLITVWNRSLNYGN